MTGKQMDKTTLVSIIESHRRDSLGSETGTLSTERATAMNHYHGRPYGNEVEGRSQVVDRSLMESVDWAMPAIMKVFAQSGRIAEFDPVGPEDEQLAQQESDYTNQVMMKDNNGFMVLHDAIKDTLLLKNGYVKHWWSEEDKIEEAEYSGLTLDALTMMEKAVEAKGGTVEYLGQKSRFIDVPGMPPANPAMQIMVPPQIELFDVKLRVTTKQGKLIWMAVPSEEVRVSRKCRGSLQESPFTEHVTTKTRSDLIEMGLPQDFVYGLAAHTNADSTLQSYARDSVSDETNRDGTAQGDSSMDDIEFCEAYIKVDYDGDGIAELRKVVTCAGEIPPGDDWNEAIPAVPMTSFVAKRVPHRHVGESLDDELSDLQEIMTVLKRQLLDNIYLNNNSEIVVNENANLRDFMTRTPGGIKRVEGPVQNSVMPLITTPIIDKILPVIDHFEGSKESRSGISRASTGLDPDILQNTTKGAFMENLNRASQKMEMITRMLAETGVKESVLQCHGILMRHQDQARTVQLRGKWVPVNPTEWRERTDLTVRVGLGTGSEEEQRNKLSMLSALQQQLLQALVGAPPQVYQRLYAMFEDIAQTMGFESPDKYAVAPNSQEHQQMIQQAEQVKQQQGPGGDDLSKAAQIQAQAQVQVQMARNQANMQVKAAEDQFKREKAMLEVRMDAQDREAERRHELLMQGIELRSKESIAAMQQEVQAWIKGLQFDLGQPGISAGVQGAPGVAGPNGAMGGAQMMPPMDQQMMPPDGMGQ